MDNTTNNESTRQKILRFAAEEIHLHGFQACNLSAIIQKAGISKGALYHHFSNKQALAYAVLDEVFAPKLFDMWQPVFGSDNPLASMIGVFHEALSWANVQSISLGCPVNNLAQEISPIDEGFRLRINAIMTQWQAGIEQALKRGQTFGCVNQAIDAQRTAVFLIASIEGVCGLAKNAQNIDVFSMGVHGLIDYVEHLSGEDHDV